MALLNLSDQRLGVPDGMLIRFTGWMHADPLISAGIGLFILPRA